MFQKYKSTLVIKCKTSAQKGKTTNSLVASGHVRN